MSMMACSVVFSPPSVRPARRPRLSPSPFFRRQARSRAVCLQAGRVDHDDLLLAALGCQPLHHPGENPLVAPPLPAIAEGLGRAMLPMRVTPSRPIAADEDHPAQHALIIEPRLAMALRKERLQPLHLLLGQKRFLILTSLSARA